RATADGWRDDGAAIGFVPTMGALHDGHRSLLRRARADTDRVAVSLFVNPLQVGEAEDLAHYPRDEARDLEICETDRVDLVCGARVVYVYPTRVSLPHPEPGDVGDLYEGAARPGHFSGVLQV